MNAARAQAEGASRDFGDRPKQGHGKALRRSTKRMLTDGHGSWSPSTSVTRPRRGEADVEADAEQRGGRAASRFWLAAVLPLAMEPRNLGPRIVAVTVRVSTPPVRAPGRDRQDNERP